MPAAQTKCQRIVDESKPVLLLEVTAHRVMRAPPYQMGETKDHLSNNNNDSLRYQIDSIHYAGRYVLAVDRNVIHL